MLCFILIIIATVSLRNVQSLFYNDSSNYVRHGSCRFRSVRQAELHWNSPGRSMTESFVLDDVEYKLCRYRVTWDEALVFCSSHKAHLATLDNEEKIAFVIQAIASSSSVSEDYWIGARKLYSDPWTWSSNEMRVSSENDIISNIPVWYPGFESDDIHCLTIDRSGHNEPIFVPRDCNQRRGFICQRENDRAFDNKIRMVFASRVGEQEFRLYAGRATWNEAVVQCRQEGLQIGEVRTVEEARALAISMLRNRPEAIESAWIGGYTRMDDPSTWRWLASGDKIENNDMWRNNLSESSGGCLLLDRHVCETPVYVESTCDRKRDVLCQKPSKKRLSKTPVAVFVDGCPYWIGFYLLNWSDAKRSCESLNASLVVLDSPVTISHMMSLMLDNKAELRHIWTDGRRSKTKGRWEWSVTGESIPNFGKSFIPWCSEDDYNTNDSGCLNLDRENLDSPLVYGLSCREKQTYVCQPRAGDCVSLSTTKLPPDNLRYVSEDIKKRTIFESPPSVYQNMATLPMSTVTTPYPMTNHNYDVIQTTLDSENNNLDDLITWKSNDSISGRNSSSSDNLTQYLKPFSQFVLPSLPQFGIKVVSAAETTTNPLSFENKKKKNKAYKFLTTSSYASSSTLHPPSSFFPTTVKKLSNDARKASKISVKSANSSITSNLSDFFETTTSSISIESKTEKSFKIVNSTRPAYTQISSSLKSFSSSKNASKSSKASKISTTSSSILSDDLSFHSSNSDVGRTKEYSIKTTRDLYSSNATKIDSVTTTKAPDTPNLTDEKKIKSDLKEYRKNAPVLVDSFATKNSRLNSTLITRRKQNSRVTTEATTPYDAIDEDYYNDEMDDKIVKKTVEENAKENGESNEYSEDYDTTSSGKLQTKKKAKQTLISSIRKNNTKSSNSEKDDEEDEDDEDEEEDEVATKSSIPIAEELSKNLENALVNMMKQGVERKKSEQVEANLRAVVDEKKSENVENVPWIKDRTNTSIENKLKSSKLENFSLRPYYSFEGPMIVALSDNAKLGGNVERTADSDGSNGREFKLIGKKFSDENYPDNGKIEGKQLSNNETRRQIKIEQSNHRNPVSNIGISMSGIPPFQPNDPNSLVQLGRYFKNKFGGFVQNSERIGDERRPLFTNTREDIERSDQRKYGSPGRPYSQDKLRGYPVNREEELRRKGQRLEKLRRPGIREPESNYYDGTRRLYPRGNYDIYGSLAQQGGRRNQERFRENQERLEVAWPDKNVSYYENFDELRLAVSPRSFPIPIRTTRSFHDEIGVGKMEIAKQRPLPDFKLSKLVKEVKIDLDQRMLRRYLEGFARKIAKNNHDAKGDDWKNTWRQLLKQMLSVLERMNINFNGDLLKLKVGSNDRENKLKVSLGNLRKLGWKSNLRKQRKDSMNTNTKNYNNQLKKTNETLQKNFGVENRLVKLMEDRKISPNSLQTKDPTKMNSKAQIKVETTDSYRRIYDNRDSVTKSPSEEEKVKESAVRGRNINNEKFGDESSLNRKERTDRPAVETRGNFRQMSNLFQPKYTNFNNSQIVRGSQSIVPMARLSTVFGYRPLMPQLHHRIIFQPGWGQTRANLEPGKAFFSGEYLPKGTLSRIVGSEYKNEHFGGKINDADKSETQYLVSTSSTAKPEANNLENSLKNKNFHSGVTSMSEKSFGDDFKVKEPKKSNENDINRDRKVSETNNKMNGAWRNEDLARYYNVTYVDESNDRKIDDNEEETRGEVNEEIVDEAANPSEDYERKPVWSPAHRLTKALELSVLRKFGANPSNSKNLVTRSVKEIEAINRSNISQTASRKIYNRGEKIEENLEYLDEEPSIVSLRMIMNPEKKSTRFLRQSQDPQIAEVNPQTVEVHVQFSGKEESTKPIKGQSYTRNHIVGHKIKNQTFHGSSMNNQSLRRDSVHSLLSANIKDKNFHSLVAAKRPKNFIDKERRRAMLNRLRERSRNLKRNYLRSYRQNGTTMSDPRERKYRNTAMGRKNMLSDIKTSKEIPKERHYIATSLRSFNDKNLTNIGENKWRKGGKSYGNDLGIDWTDQASALFADLKETNEDLTLYIDLTLGRVGSKPRNRGRSSV